MMRLPTLLFLFLIHSVGFAHDRILVISDIDDTIKVSGNTKDDFAKYLNTKIEYTGMSQLYNLLVQSHGADLQLDYVTNAPSFIKRSRMTFLKYHKYPEALVHFNDTVKGQSHKYKTIKNLITTFQPKKIILIGDTATKDTEVYTQIKNDYLNQLQVFIYIHKIYADKTTTASKDYFSYITMPELAYKMYLDGFILENSLHAVLDSTLPSINAEIQTGESLTPFDLSFPAFMDCSSYRWTLPAFERLNTIKMHLENKCHFN